MRELILKGQKYAGKDSYFAVKTESLVKESFSQQIFMILLMCCWILFANILLRIFASIFISDIGL